jgi:hypothetical protein
MIFITRVINLRYYEGFILSFVLSAVAKPYSSVVNLLGTQYKILEDEKKGG